jgi:hypothetical protein
MTKKGQDFERDTAALAGECVVCKGTGTLGKERCPSCKGRKRYGRRIPRSGAYGTMDGFPQLTGDASWDFPWLTKPIVIECKHGYPAKNQKGKSMILQREWFDKHLESAKNMELLPAFAMKFKFTAEDGISKFIVIPFPVMEKMLKEINNLYLEVKEYREQKERGNKRP